MFRVGIGQDSHKIKFQAAQRAPGSKLQTRKKLVLGGVEVSGDYYAVANSDGDVVLHALVNALSSAIGGPSLSFYADPLCKKGIIDSRHYVKEVLRRMGEYRVNNVGVAIEAKEPKLERFLDQMRGEIAKILGIGKEDVGVTVTLGEGLTPFGKGEGIQAFVIVSLYKNE